MRRKLAFDPNGDTCVGCVVNGRFLGAPMTGVQRVATEVLHAIASAQDDRLPWLDGMQFAIAVPPALANRAAAFGLPVQVLSPLSGNLWEQITLPLRTDADVVLNLCNMGPLARRRSVTMIHDAQVFQSPQSYSGAFRAWYAFAHRRIGREHAAVLTVSHFSAGELTAAGVTDRARPVYNGSDHICRVVADARILDRLALERGRYVVAPSSTLAHKNLGLLLRVFAAPEMNDVPLILYGSADRATFLARGMTPSSNVVFAGRVDDGEMRALLEEAACFAFPSRTEGFGLPPLEAMQLGCPVVTTGCGAIREVCGDAALYAGPDDDAAWIDRILSLRNQADQRARFVAAGRARAEAFTWAGAARNIAEIVRKVAAAD